MPLILMTPAIAGKLSEYAKINFYLALGLTVCGYFLIGFLIYGIVSARKWLERQRRCDHGIRAGSGGHCQLCQAETNRLQKQREAEAVECE